MESRYTIWTRRCHISIFILISWIYINLKSDLHFKGERPVNFVLNTNVKSPIDLGKLVFQYQLPVHEKECHVSWAWEITIQTIFRKWSIVYNYIYIQAWPLSFHRFPNSIKKIWYPKFLTLTTYGIVLSSPSTRLYLSHWQQSPNGVCILLKLQTHENTLELFQRKQSPKDSRVIPKTYWSKTASANRSLNKIILP